jgi:hypothetical protein
LLELLVSFGVAHDWVSFGLLLLFI